jgi:gamma-D-glutamyl-L-lysine dipeptidyl-peptidase
MNYAVCAIPVLPIRLAPVHTAEMITQQLFGEVCMVLEKGSDNWIKIRCKYDEQEGWVLKSQLLEIGQDLYEETVNWFAGDWVNRIELNGEPMMVPFGAALPGYRSGKAVWGNAAIEYSGNLEYLPADEAADTRNHIKALAFMYWNSPYLWGGKTVFGTDCSGFTQQVFKLAGIVLPRNASEQALQGEDIGFLQEAACGDLAFFDNAAGNIIHVGILLNDREIIHAAGKVRIDRIDNQGILNSETGERTHQLRILRRYC